MPAITTLISLAGVAASIGGVATAAMAAAAQEKAGKEQLRRAEEALKAQKPSKDTRAEIRLGKRDKKLKRGKGSLAQRKKEEAAAGSAGGLETKSASEVGGL